MTERLRLPSAVLLSCLLTAPAGAQTIVAPIGAALPTTMPFVPLTASFPAGELGMKLGFDGSSLLSVALPVPGAAPFVLGQPVGAAASAFSGYPRHVFSDEARISGLLVRAIDEAKDSIDIAIHGLSLPEVAEALSRAKSRRAAGRDGNVRVRVLINRSHVFPDRKGQSRSPEIQRLLDEGFDVRVLRGGGPYGVMHNKLAIFDGSLMMGGSYNWSKAADNQNWENARFTTDAHRLAGFMAYWEWMWQAAQPVSRVDVLEAFGPELTIQAPTDPTRPVSFHGEGFPAYSFSPNGGTQDWLAKAVSLAEESIDLAMFSFTSSKLQQALLAAKEKGVRVRIVFDRSQAGGLKEMRWFIEQGFEVRLSKGRGGMGVMHNKFAVFDGVFLETGAFNWTMNAERNNYENAEFLDEPSEAAAYAAYFERLYSGASEPDLKELEAEGVPEGFEIH